MAFSESGFHAFYAKLEVGGRGRGTEGEREGKGEGERERASKNEILFFN